MKKTAIILNQITQELIIHEYNEEVINKEFNGDVEEYLTTKDFFNSSCQYMAVDKLVLSIENDI